MKRFSLPVFFVLAFGLSIGFLALSAKLPGFPQLYPFGPLLSALIVAGATGGLRDFFSRCVRWRAGVQWYAAALLVPAALGLAAALFNIQLGASAPAPASAGAGRPWYAILLLFPLAMIDAPLQEESAWRGFALPRFPARLSPLANSLLLGALLAGWHAPLVFSEPSLLAPYLLATLASAIVSNWVFYNTKGSALLVILYHTSLNTVGLYFRPSLEGASIQRYWWLLAAFTAAAALVIVLVTGPTLQGRKPAAAAPVRA